MNGLRFNAWKAVVMRNLVWVAVLLLSCGSAAVAAGERHVIILTLDGFPAYLLNDPKAPIPTIRKLAAEGAVATAMHVVNPSVTWPNHTTLSTGVLPAKHGVIFNGLLVRGGPGLPVRVDWSATQQQLVHAPTIWEAAHRAGLSTAAIFWPCTNQATEIDDVLPDMAEPLASTTPRLRDELIAAGALPGPTSADWDRLSQPQRDQVYVTAACRLIRQRKPNLLLLHFVLLDYIHHNYGPQTAAGYTAMAVLDAQVREVMRAVDEAQIAEQTTLFLTADHGFIRPKKLIEPNVILRKAGLLHAGPAEIVAAQVQALPEGGIAMIYLTSPAKPRALITQVIELFKGKEGITDIITPDRFASLGLPNPATDNHMADLILSTNDDYAFGGTAAGDAEIREPVMGVSMVGYHGYLSSNPKMAAIFIAHGPGIKAGVQLGEIDNTSVGPTAAAILGLSLPSADGKPLKQLLPGQ